MLRWIRSRGEGKLERGKYCSFQLQGSVVIVSCHEIQTSRGCCARYDASNVWPTFWIITAVVLPPLQPRGKCYSFSLNPPRYDRLMGIVRSVSREYATELSCYIVKRAGRVGGGRCRRRANPSTHQNLLELTKFWLHTRVKRGGGGAGRKMGNGTRFHGIPLRIRPPVIGSNARILKIRNTPPFWNTVRSIMSRDFRLSLLCYGSRESASINLRINRRNASYIARVQVEKRIGFWLVLYSPYGWERERERGQRERPRVYRRYQRYWVEGRRELGPRVYF